MFDADMARKKAIYDDELDRDYRTKEIRVLRRGALSMYWDAFEKFKAVFVENPDLKEGIFGDEIVEEIEKYQTILKLTGREWPENFPLQEFIDFRASRGFPDKLPTSIDLEDQQGPTETGSDEQESDSADKDSSQPNSGKTAPDSGNKKFIETKPEVDSSGTDQNPSANPPANRPATGADSKGGTRPN
jgi:hypothetical protein